MSGRVVVVGSGPSGVHFALSLLRKGYEVAMLDVGHARPAVARPDDSFRGLKRHLDDPAGYFLGDDCEGVTFPGAGAEYYGMPPSKSYIFRDVPSFKSKATGFAPLFSFAAGGLAETWTAGAYPFNDAELADFPFGYAELAPHYAEVARRIGIGGEADDLARFFPVHDELAEPLALDEHSRRLLARYADRREALNRGQRAWLGRSRVATLARARPEQGRRACGYSGRCLYGCPTGALWTPALTLAECRDFPGFRYLPGMYVSHFTYDRSRRVRAVIAEPVAGGAAQEIPADTLVLAAGALASSKIFLESLHRGSGEVVRLPGLMDNQQILIPFVNLGMLGRPYESESYQYHQVALGLEGDQAKTYVHAQLTTLKTALVHPIVQSLPLDLRSSAAIFRTMRSALGVANVNLHDTRRADSYLTLEPDPRGGHPTLVIHYAAPAGDADTIRSAIDRTKRALRTLGCVAPPGMTHVRPKGASVHYSGTLPMSRAAAPLTTSAECRSHDFENLFVADGSTFPFLPAKNITFTLMANAVRVAAAAF